jgi:hypothetical protein
MKGNARCGSKPARRRCKAFFTKDLMRHAIPEEPARRDSTLAHPSASTGPLKNIDASSPARKAHAKKYTKKLAAFQALSNCHGPYRNFVSDGFRFAIRLQEDGLIVLTRKTRAVRTVLFYTYRNEL